MTVNARANRGGVAVNNFKQALHLSVATAEGHEFICKGEIGHMGIGLYLKSWVIL